MARTPVSCADATPAADKPRPTHVLLVEPEDGRARELTAALEGRFGPGCVERVRGGAELAQVDLARVDVAVCAAGAARESLAAIVAVRHDLPAIVTGSGAEPGAARRAVEIGAADFVVAGGEALVAAVEKNLAQAKTRAEERREREEMKDALARLRARNEELERAVRDLETMALSDPLTSLANRRLLSERLNQMYAQAVRYGSDLACLMIDLDGFKAINDTLGHQRGDELLSLAGRVIARSIRSSDVAARFGGDEFVLLLPHTSCTTAATLAARLAAAFQREAGRLGRVGMRCGMSIGIACLGLSAAADGEQLLAQADNALYAAKEAGKSRIMVCGPDGVTALEPGALTA